jgi:hypothetical protein
VFRRALDLTQGGRARTYRLSVISGLSEAVRGIGRTRESAEYMRQVMIELDSMGFRGTSIMPNAITFLSGPLFELGEFVAVDSALGAALQAQLRVPGQHSSSTLSFLFGLGKLRMGELDSADVWISRAMRDTSEGGGGLSAYLPPALTQLRLEQGRVTEARHLLASLPTGTLIRRVSRSWLTSRVRYAEGATREASAMLEDSMRAIVGAAPKPPPALAMPFVTAAEWRLAAGDARGADSLAQLGRNAAAVDSLALVRSAYAGRAELVRARAHLSLGDTAAARLAADRGVVAMSNGYGPANWHTAAARSFRDSLPK